MRLNRTKLKESMKKEKNRNYILFFIILPLSALLFGVLIGRFIIIPKYILNEKKATENNVAENKTIYEKEEEKKTYEEYVFPEGSIKYMQLGSFNKKVNAENYCSILKSKDIPCTILKGKEYLVLTGGFIQDSPIENIKEHLNKSGVEFFTKEIKKPSKKVLLENQESKELLQRQVSSLEDWLKTTMDFIWSGKEKGDLKNKLKDSTVNLKESLKEEVILKDKNDSWNDFTKKLEEDLKDIEKEKKTTYQLFDVHESILQGLIKFYNTP